MKKKHIDYSNWSKEELIKELKRIKETTYGLVWHRDVPQEKIDVLINPDARTPEELFVNEVAGKPFPVLKEIKSREVVSNKEGQTHILIEGDNYHALAILNFTHWESVDVICIDPPYNRGAKGGNDFRYNDNFVDSEDPFRHSKWLSFMERRLKLAKNLLKSTGVIFINIDNTEQAPLRLLCDEIFGEKNFVGSFIWRKKEGGGQADAYFVTEHEYILVYAKSKEFQWRDEKIPLNSAQFNKEDQSGKFTAVKLAKWGNTARREDRPKMYFPIKCPNGKNIYPIAPDGEDGRWRVGKKRMEMLIKNDLVFWQQREGEWVPYEKIYFNEGEVKKVKERSILYDLATTADGTNELTDIFGKKDFFENPKPSMLVKFLLEHSTEKEGFVVLDFFAGSGTTGHAVLELNKEDGGNRKFILCTNNENKIATEVCHPRLEKVMKGYKNHKGEKNAGLGGNLKYFTAYDFVESEPSDKNKHKLVNRCAEMLCIKEGIFDVVTEAEDFKIFKNNDNQYFGIVFYEDAIDAYKKAINKIDATISTYVFSLGDDPHTAQFSDIAGKVILQPIPEIILKVYQEIFR